jgi:hypothetical protein
LLRLVGAPKNDSIVPPDLRLSMAAARNRQQARNKQVTHAVQRTDEERASY